MVASEISEAIEALIDDALDGTELEGRAHEGEAPPDSATPYVVFEVAGLEHDGAIDSVAATVTPRLAVAVFVSGDEGRHKARELADLVNDALDGKSMSDDLPDGIAHIEAMADLYPVVRRDGQTWQGAFDINLYIELS